MGDPGEQLGIWGHLLSGGRNGNPDSGGLPGLKITNWQLLNLYREFSGRSSLTVAAWHGQQFETQFS